MLVLDDTEPVSPEDTIHEKNELACSLLHGDGSNRWFDKSLTMVVFKNGKCGVNCEHSWYEARGGNNVALRVDTEGSFHSSQTPPPLSTLTCAPFLPQGRRPGDGARVRVCAGH